MFLGDDRGGTTAAVPASSKTLSVERWAYLRAVIAALAESTAESPAKLDRFLPAVWLRPHRPPERAVRDEKDPYVIYD